MGTQDAINRKVDEVFASASYFEDVIKIFNEEFDKYNICVALDGYRGSPFIVMTDMDKPDEELHKFTLISEAFKFALEKYKQAVQLEASSETTSSVVDEIASAFEKAIE